MLVYFRNLILCQGTKRIVHLKPLNSSEKLKNTLEYISSKFYADSITARFPNYSHLNEFPSNTYKILNDYLIKPTKEELLKKIPSQGDSEPASTT